VDVDGPRPGGWTGFAFGVAGAGTADGDPMEAGDVLPVEGDRSVEFVPDGSESSSDGDDAGFRVVCVAGEPHGEPIRQRGPYVL